MNRMEERKEKEDKMLVDNRVFRIGYVSGPLSNRVTDPIMLQNRGYKASTTLQLHFLPTQRHHSLVAKKWTQKSSDNFVPTHHLDV